jgi:hypothetical protein
VIVTGTTTRGEKKKEKKRYYKKKGGDAHVCREWDSDKSSTDSSSDKDAANIAVNKGLLFPNVGHKCFMAKDDKKKKVQSRTTPKYTTSSACFLLSLQVPKSKINAEWLERDMVTVGVAKVVKDLLYFMSREVLHQQGLFYNKNGNLQHLLELSLYTLAHSV